MLKFSRWNVFSAIWFSLVAALSVLDINQPAEIESEGFFSSSLIANQYELAVLLFLCALPCGWLVGNKIAAIKEGKKAGLGNAIFLGVVVVLLTSINFSIFLGISEENTVADIFSLSLGKFFLVTVFGGILIYPIGILGAILLWVVKKYCCR